jgi:uncharacterized protein
MASGYSQRDAWAMTDGDLKDQAIQPLNTNPAFVPSLASEMVRLAGVEHLAELAVTLNAMPVLDTPRRFMQFVATDLARANLGDDFWLALAEPGEAYVNTPILIYDDMRFANERQAIRDWAAARGWRHHLIAIARDSADTLFGDGGDDGHVSENSYGTPDEYDEVLVFASGDVLGIHQAALNLARREYANSRQAECWIQSAFGNVWHPLCPQLDIICPAELAYALSKMCRFSGHPTAFYSVAQHSVLCAELVDTPAEKLAALLHDAAECYGFADVPSPVKRLPFMAEYRAAELRCLTGILANFGLPGEVPNSVKHADLVMLATEKRDAMASEPQSWGALPEPTEQVITPLEHQEAQALWTDAWAKAWADYTKECQRDPLTTAD